MVITLVTQIIFVTILLLCPWNWLADYMEVEAMDTSDFEQTKFRIYLLLIPAIHLVLAIAIEVSILCDIGSSIFNNCAVMKYGRFFSGLGKITANIFKMALFINI